MGTPLWSSSFAGAGSLRMDEGPPSADGGIFKELYTQLAAEPVVSRAWLFPSVVGEEEVEPVSTGDVVHYSVLVQTTQCSFARNAKAKAISEYRLTVQDVHSSFAKASSFPNHLPGDVKGVTVSPTGKWRCVLRSREDKGQEKQELEVWSHSALVCVVDLTDLHGKVMFDNDQFGHIRWSPCENFLTYCAEYVTSKEEKVCLVVRTMQIGLLTRLVLSCFCLFL